MRLSVVFELLLIFVLLAFAASRSVERKGVRKRGIQQRKKNERQENPINKYCSCTDTLCNCCREFQLPLVNLNGPGCASLMYLLGDRMAVSLSFGDRVITNQTLSGRKPQPVCMPLPGRISKFCGRVYNIGRDKEDFRACLGLELHSKKTVEAAVRVSCFRFGPRGVSAEGADPLPLASEQDEEDDDDDDDDDYGIGDDDDDEDDDEEEDDDEAESEEAADNDVDDTADYGGFSILSEDILGGLFGGSGGNRKPPKRKAVAAVVTTSTTTTTTTTTRRPRPSRRSTTTRRPPPTRTRRPRPTRPNGPRRRTTTTTSTTTTTAPPPTAQDVTEVPIQLNTVATILGQTSGLIHIPGTISNEENIASNIIAHGTETSEDQSFQPVQLVSPTSKTQEVFAKPSSQAVTPIEDFGIQSSLADITDQLSASPITTIITSTKPIQESSIVQVTEKIQNFEKIETLQQAVTASMAMDDMTKAPLRSSHNVVKKPGDDEKDKDMIEIVESFSDDDDEMNMKQSVESVSSESKEDIASDESNVSEMTLESNSREKRVKKHKKKNQESDLDLGLSLISESLGFGGGGKKKKDKKPNNKVEQITTHSNLKKNEDYDDILGLGSLSETLGFTTSNRNKNKQDKRKRENKMMKYDWEQFV